MIRSSFHFGMIPPNLFGVIENAERLTGEKVKFLFLDEVQHLCDWEIFIKSAYDTEIFEKIYITGSNSQLLQNRFSALLSGRISRMKCVRFLFGKFFVRKE